MRPRFLPNILWLTKEILRKAVLEYAPSDAQGVAPVFVAVDATAGNGHDTLFLAQLVTEASRACAHTTNHDDSPVDAHVYSFDVQEQAVKNTTERVAKAGFADCVTVLHQGHETVGEAIPPEHQGCIAVATYNLGYLPGSDKQTITRSRTTIASLESLLPMVRPNGVVSVHIYTGHEGGTAEGDAVLRWAEQLDWKAYKVGRYDFPNKRENREVLLVIERLV